MEVSRAENLPPPPGIINSIKAGFDVIAMRITAIFFPLLLNLFLWLGPRLRMNALFDSIKSDAVAIWKSGGISAEDIQRALDWYEATIPHINLFWLLRTLPIGVSSLQFSQGIQTPLGTPAVLQASVINLFGWMFLLTLVGWIGGGLYFRGVARLTLGSPDEQIGIPRAIAQTILLSVVWSVISAVIVFSFLILLAILFQLSQLIAEFFVLFLSLASMWAIVPLYFWSHGIFIKKQNVVASMLSSFQLTRFTLPTSSMFVLTIFLLAVGLNFLWSIPPTDSWVTLVGIFGHSFVTTALLASSFIYYRDMNIWLQAMIEKMKSKQAS